MDKRLLQTYASWAKKNLEEQIEISLKTLGINGDDNIRTARRVGDVTIIDGDQASYPADLYDKRNQIVGLVKSNGYQNVIEEFAYTWFNRIISLRFMEVHNFLSHGFRVLSSKTGDVEPEILKNLSFARDDLRLDLNYCSSLREQNKIEELFRYVLIQQCKALAEILPMLFSDNMSYLDLLIPKVLLRGDTAITKLLEIPEEAFLEDVEVIGWLYQFYISEKKDKVNKDKKTITKDTLPAVTQLFTPDWIVRYMAENSVGRIWLESYPESSLRNNMKYYVDDAEQTEEVQKEIDAIKYKNVNPEEIKVIEPCCGSGHILVYVFDLLYKMYEEKGYNSREIPTLILKNNLHGLDVDKRAAQLSSFALVMKARTANNKFFNHQYYVVPKVYEILDSKYLDDLNYSKQLKDLDLLTNEEYKEVVKLVEQFKYGKTIGSLLKIKPVDYRLINEAIVKARQNAIVNVFNADFLTEGLSYIKYLNEIAKILSDKYDVMITNPPYIGISSMEAPVKEYAIKNYPNSKTDMFAMFMETNFTKRNGFVSMINMHSWMFLGSYQILRESLLLIKTIMCMAHLGARGFDSIGGEVVQTVAFVLKNGKIDNYRANYSRLVSYSSEKEKREHFLKKDSVFLSESESFIEIPGTIIAYWLSSKLLSAFKNGRPLSPVASPCVGLQTGDNGRFVRIWYEVCYQNIKFNANSRLEAKQSEKKWFPYNKGGEFRKWYGNNDCIVNWENDGFEIRNNIGENGRLASRPQNMDYYFRPSITWSKISTGIIGFRYKNPGHIFDVAGTSIFSEDQNLLMYVFGALNSKVIMELLKAMSPTVNFEVGQIANLPIIRKTEDEQNVIHIVKDNINLSKNDWDSFETSWDFEIHPLIKNSKDMWNSSDLPELMNKYRKNGKSIYPLELCYLVWEEECKDRFDQLKTNEEELNRIFIDIYGLQDELTPEVEDKDVTVRLADKERDIKSLISYLVGVVMGRYSLDVDGLAYAGGDWDDSKYMSYQPDQDGVVPVYSSLGMEDSLTARIIELIKMIFGEQSYKENIDFVADALGKKQSESSEETLNRYLNDDFYYDHLKIYQKRPIYWMLSSGKNSGFKCLIYIHRYNKETLANINGKYFLPESTRLKNELDEINASIESVEGKERVRLEKERQKLAEKYNEAIEYGQVLDHMANRFIDIDLDDGVKENYNLFQGVEIVSDNGLKIKKDLLVPIK